jgi:hypothetical protein
MSTIRVLADRFGPVGLLYLGLAAVIASSALVGWVVR